MQSNFEFMDSVPPINNVTPFDRTVLAATLWAEARGEKHQGMWLVAWVIRNRVTQRRWNAQVKLWSDYGDTLPRVRPNSFAAVCLYKWQFSCWNPNDPNHETIYNIVTDIKVFQYYLKKDKQFKDALEIANKIDGCYKEDPVDGANMYFNPKVCNPTWDNMVRCVKCSKQYDLDKVEKCPQCGYNEYERLCVFIGEYGNHRFLKEL
jgi:spore germination cell wall hydrolase CwlJ-like protein